MVPIAYYLILAAVLFCIGIAAFLIKRNVITIFMSIELMLNAVNLTFVAFAHMWHQVSGQIFVFFVMVVAAAEAAVGLAIIIAVFRVRSTRTLLWICATTVVVVGFRPCHHLALCTPVDARSRAALPRHAISTRLTLTRRPARCCGWWWPRTAAAGGRPGWPAAGSGPCAACRWWW